MKRVVAGMLLVVILVSGCAVAENTDAMTTMELVIQTLNLSIGYYKNHPESLADSEIMIIYEAFEIMVHLDAFSSATSWLTIEGSGSASTDVISEMMKTTGKAEYELAAEPGEVYYKWLNGKVSGEECMNKIIEWAELYLAARNEQK